MMPLSPQSELSEGRQGWSSSTGDEEESLAVLRRWVLQISTPAFGSRAPVKQRRWVGCMAYQGTDIST